MQEYYSGRAAEYEKIYSRDDPVRQSEQRRIAEIMQEVFLDKNVLEVACGTGYWTERIAQVANHVVAIDFSGEVLEIAREKAISPGKASFRQADAYRLEECTGNFNAGCANFWFSHVPKARVNEFIEGFHHKIGRGAAVFMADNVHVPGLGGHLTSEGTDTYKKRELSDGRTFKVVKNYYDAGQLKDIFSHRVKDLHIRMGNCFWWIKYTVG